MPSCLKLYKNRQVAEHPYTLQPVYACPFSINDLTSCHATLSINTISCVYALQQTVLREITPRGRSKIVTDYVKLGKIAIRDIH